MAKTSRPDRKRGDRRERAPSEYEETTLSVDRVTRVVKGGRRMRFRAIVVIGNKKGKVGLGTGKAADVQAAVRKATTAAKRAMIRVPIKEGTLPHGIDLKFKAARIRLLPASAGTGIIAGGALRVILDHCGVKDVLSKRYGTGNKLVNAQATMLALSRMRGPAAAVADEAEAVVVTDQGASPKKGDKDIRVDQAEAAKADEAVLEGMDVQEISRDDIDKEGNLRKK